MAAAGVEHELQALHALCHNGPYSNLHVPELRQRHRSKSMIPTTGGGGGHPLLAGAARRSSLTPCPAEDSASVACISQINAAVPRRLGSGDSANSSMHSHSTWQKTTAQPKKIRRWSMFSMSADSRKNVSSSSLREEDSSGSFGRSDHSLSGRARLGSVVRDAACCSHVCVCLYVISPRARTTSTRHLHEKVHIISDSRGARRNFIHANFQAIIFAV
jgi:hypothetical protein